jgi:hypothetical protein
MYYNLVNDQPHLPCLWYFKLVLSDRADLLARFAATFRNTQVVMDGARTQLHGTGQLTSSCTWIRERKTRFGCDYAQMRGLKCYKSRSKSASQMRPTKCALPNPDLLRAAAEAIGCAVLLLPSNQLLRHLPWVKYFFLN